MRYTILCYGNEDAVGSWSKEQEAEVMNGLEAVGARLTTAGKTGSRQL